MTDETFGNVTASMPDITNIVAAATLAPEMLVLATTLVLLLGGVFAANRHTDRLIMGLGIFVLVTLAGLMVIPPLPYMRQLMFSNMYVSDGFSHFVKSLLVTGTALVFMLSSGWLERGTNQRFEFPVLMLFSLLGSMLMVSANDLLSLYVGLELSSLPLYVLASMQLGGLKSAEAGLKYFVLGALASGMLLFGISLIYGFTGTTGFEALTHLYRHGFPSSLPAGAVTGLVLLIAGLSFKISAAPFHMWAPDVYEGAPTPVTAYFSIVPKLAALALFTRILNQPFGAMIGEWRQVIVAISILSMAVGAFGALMQTNIKRLLAYSSIGHVGYALMGVASGTEEGVASMLIYFSLYIAISAGAFACVLMMNANGEALENINDLAGLSRTRPRMAFALAVFMFSMAGIPPLSGFFGKLYVFLAALHSGLTGLAVTGVLASVVACYYYLKVIKVMYFDEPALSFDKEVSSGTRITLVICTAVTFLFFLVPTPLVIQAKMAAHTLFAHP